MPKLGVDWAELQSCWERVRDSGEFTEGYFVRSFEAEVEDWCGLNAVAVSSAGAGLYAVMSNLGGGLPRRAAVPVNTFYATGAMAREAGYDLQLVDCRRDDLSMSVDALDCAPGPIGAVLMTHVGGGLARDYEAICIWASRRRLPVVEDAAHALGASFQGRTAGQHSTAAVFSLYPTKAVPAGEGGVVVTADWELAERVREFRNYGKRRDQNGVIRYGRGFNLRMDEWTAAVAYLQMRRLPQILEARAAAAHRLWRVVAPLTDYGPGAVSNWYKYVVPAQAVQTLSIKRTTGKVYARSDQLTEALGLASQGPFPNAEWAADNHACLPLDENGYDGMPTHAVLSWLQGRV